MARTKTSNVELQTKPVESENANVNIKKTRKSTTTKVTKTASLEDDNSPSQNGKEEHLSNGNSDLNKPTRKPRKKKSDPLPDGEEHELTTTNTMNGVVVVNNKEENNHVVVSEKTPRKRREISKQSVQDEFEKLINQCSSFNLVGKSKEESKEIKQLTKALKTLKTDTLRIAKPKKVARAGNVASGFLKPVHISPELSKFAGWDKNETFSRVQGTKFICDYIKMNDLQNPKDRRVIIPDEKIAKFLEWKDTDEPLTYVKIQQRIQRHFANTPFQ